MILVLVVLVGIVGSAPVLETSAVMDQISARHSLSLLQKLVRDVPRTHAAWVNSQTLALDDEETRRQLLFQKESSIPAPPLLQQVWDGGSLERFLTDVFRGLKLHVELLRQVEETLLETRELQELQADLRDLLLQIYTWRERLGRGGSAGALEAPDLSAALTGQYHARVLAHLTLQQLKDFAGSALLVLDNTPL